MANYTIYQLDEGDMTISGGEQLDGITGGNGSHLVGETITFNTTNWTGINISDNDSNFSDNDSSQTLDGAQTVDGVSYTSGTHLEAEYGLTVTDGTNTWTLIGFNINNSSHAYSTVEGIAVIGAPGDFPPSGVPLTVVSAHEGPNYSWTEYVAPVCFTLGTYIRTPDGDRLIDDLRPGDMVSTVDHGPQALRWVHRHSTLAYGKSAPVKIKANALGNQRDLLVSQQHRMLLDTWKIELIFGKKRALLAAVSLVNNETIYIKEGGTVTYLHLLFDAHELIWAEGAQTESLFISEATIGDLDDAARDELLLLFPELISGAGMKAASPIIEPHEASLILS